MKRAAGVLILMASTASAQGAGRTCALVWDNLPATSHAELNRIDGKSVWIVGGGFRARCAGTTQVVTSDSAEYYEAQQLVLLIGRANYREQGASLQADRIRYNAGDEYLEATGNVRARSGNSLLTATHVLYYRPSPGLRTHTEAYATGRPRLTLRDSAGPGSDTAATVVDSDRLRMFSDSLFYAGGNVIITRPDVSTRSDSLESDRVRNTARLVGGPPHVQGLGANKFTLDGRIIDLYGRERRLSRVVTKGNAVAVSDSLRLTADTIDLRMANNQIDSVMAWGGGRSRAVSPRQDIEATSISLSMPGQQLRSLYATGRARVETVADSAVKTKERDWIVGDTLTATFIERRVRADSSREPALRTLVAWGNAQSYYQVPPDDGRDSLPSLSYVAGRRILIDFDNGEISSVRVLDEVRGILLEPVRRDTTGVIRRMPAPAKPR